MPRWNKRPRRRTPTPESESDENEDIVEVQPKRLKKFFQPRNLMLITVLGAVWLWFVLMFTKNKSVRDSTFRCYFLSYGVIAYGLYRKNKSVVSLGRYLMGFVICFVFVSEHTMEDMTDFCLHFVLLFVYIIVHSSIVNCFLAVVGMETDQQNIIDRLIANKHIK